MKFRVRTTALLLCVLLLAVACMPVSAAYVSGREAMETLHTLGLFQGTEKGFEPERTATRAEAAVMLLRLLGLEQEAEAAYSAGAAECPFTDGGWAAVWLGFAAREGLVRGRTDSYFGRDEAVSAQDYATMTLRALGYTEGTDFTWSDALSFSDSIGLTHGEYAAGGAFLREDLALISYTALTLHPNGAADRLIDLLYRRGAVSADKLMQTRLANAVNSGKRAYTAAELHEMSASAVLYIEVYDKPEDLQSGNYSGTGSAFLISPDGLAVMCYHILEDTSYARATTSDSRVFNVEEVLYYHTEQDIAVVRLSKKDTAGNTVRFFPWLALGDSDALSNGDPVYTISNPLGMIDCISDGLVSNRSRTVDDPAYPCIQITAPISSGSSGGPLLNAYGEVIGVLFASFNKGENMNLAVPINALRDVDLTAKGISVSAVREAVNAKRASASLFASETELTVKVGETKDVVISTDCPGQLGARFNVDKKTVADCLWGDFVNKQSCVLKVTGYDPGTATVTVSFAPGYGNEKASVKLTVKVVE